MSALTDSIDGMVEAKWPAIVAAQEAHAAGAGRFCQLLAVVDEPPTNGAEMLPALGRLDRKAGSETKSWRDFPGILPTKVRSRIEVQVYDGPAGKGFVLMITVKEQGEKYRRAWQQGPESWRSRGWSKLGVVP